MRNARARTRPPAIVLAGLLVAGIGAGAPATAAPTLNVGVTIASAGTEPFDADDEPGHATGELGTGTGGATIVRVNDTVTYEVTTLSNGEPLPDAAVDVVLPKGLWLDRIPEECDAESSTLDPADPFEGVETPYTENSNDQVATQTLHCARGTLPANSTQVFDFEARVGNLVPDGHLYPLTSVTLAGDGASKEATNLPVVQASAALQWNLSKIGAQNVGAESPAYWDPDDTSECEGAVTGRCQYIGYLTTISAPNGGKGAMPAIGDVSFTEHTALEEFLPGLDAADYAAIRADPARYGINWWVQNRALNGDHPVPYSRLGEDNPPQRSVGESGEFVDPATGVPFEDQYEDSGGAHLFETPDSDLTLQLSGTDWTLANVPTQTKAGSALPGVDDDLYAGSVPAYAVSVTVGVSIPIALIRDFGIDDGTGQTCTPESDLCALETHNTMSGLNLEGFGDAAQDDSASLPDGFRTVDQQVAARVGDGTISKQFVGVPGQANNTAPDEFAEYSRWYGPPGDADLWSGDITAVAGQPVISSVTVGATTDQSVLFCDVWDPSLMVLRGADVPASDNGPDATPLALYQDIGTDKDHPVWISHDSGDQAPTNIRIEYASAPAPSGEESLRCDATLDGVTWHADPADVGDDEYTTADGQTLYPSVNRVRVFADYPAGEVEQPRVWAISLAVNPDLADSLRGTTIPNYLWEARNWTPTTFEDITSGGADIYGFPSGDTYLTDPAGKAPEQYFDKLTLTSAQVRVSQQVAATPVEATEAPADDAFAATATGVAGKSSLWFKLTPTLTSPGRAEQYGDVVVEDCLPAGLTYVGASIEPVEIAPWGSQENTPAGIGDTDAHPDNPRNQCGEGSTYVRWELADQPVNAPIAPIIVRADARPDAVDSRTEQNTAAVSSPLDSSNRWLRDAQVSYRLGKVAEIMLTKQLLTPQVQINRAGQATDEPMSWQVSLWNTMARNSGSATVIDVLAREGFTGTFTFTGATLDEDSAPADIWYTADAEVQADPDNNTSTWCSVAGGTWTRQAGTGACPGTMSEVSAVRLSAPDGLDTGAHLSATLTGVGEGNAAGDLYESSAQAYAAAFLDESGVPVNIGPITVSPAVVASGLGDRFFYDNDNDSVQSGPDTPVADAAVAIAGTDDLGNPVSVVTTTDADGIYTSGPLRAGTYTVTFTAPDGEEFVTPYQGSDPAAWSSADTAGVARTVDGEAFTLGAAEQFGDADAGLKPVIPADPVPLPNAGGTGSAPYLASGLAIAAAALALARRRGARR